MSAQTITPPGAYEFTLNQVKMQYPAQTANYSIKHIKDTFHYADLYFSGWSTHVAGANSEVVYTFTAPGTLSSVSQGSIIIKDASDIVVGYYIDTIIHQNVAAIAYYKKGVGHLMDLYRISNSFTPTLSFYKQIKLSHSSQYGRISMDSHFRYGIAVVWEFPGVGIQTIVGKKGDWSSVKTLGGTTLETAPDLAFSHPDNGVLNLHFVYRNPGQQTIRVTKYNYDAL